jgi:hypothetical protein
MWYINVLGSSLFFLFGRARCRKKLRQEEYDDLYSRRKEECDLISLVGFFVFRSGAKLYCTVNFSTDNSLIQYRK